MARTVYEVDFGKYALNWDAWTPAPCPDMSDCPMWPVNAPWKMLLDDPAFVVDDKRTEALSTFTTSYTDRQGQEVVEVIGEKGIRCQLRETRGGTFGHIPWHRLDKIAKVSTNRVYEASVPGSWWNLFPSKNVVLPESEPVRRFGDPTATGTDAQYFAVDKTRNLYYEVSAFGPSWFPFKWRADRISIWRLDQDWQSQTKLGVTGAKIPLLPMIPKIEEYETGKIEHALHFIAAEYSPDGLVPPARGTDGDVPGHPLRAGERLRLRSDRVAAVLGDNPTKHDEALVYALINYGYILTDRTAIEVPHSMRQPQDPRLNVTIDLRLNDFEVVRQAKPYSWTA